MNSNFDSISVLVGRSIRKHGGQAFRKTLREVFALIADASTVNIVKEDRYFFSQSSRVLRPKAEDETIKYTDWSGVLVVDLDVKNEVAALEVKKKLSILLSKQPWFAGVVLSTSHRGVHVYTGCKPDVATITEEAYLDHAEAMSIFIWRALVLAYALAKSEGKLSEAELQDMHPEMNMSSRREERNGQLSEARMFDLATFRLSQPTLLGYDHEPFLNDNFALEPPLGLSANAYEINAGCETLKAMFDKRRGRFKVEQRAYNAEIGELPTVEQCKPRSYDNTARYRLAYTICNLYDVSSKGCEHYKLLHDCFLRMCSGNPKFSKEKGAFAAVFDSAVQRQATGLCPQIAWAINELRTVHHFDINIDNEEAIRPQVEDVDIDIELSKPVPVPPELQIQYDKVYALESNQYIGHATDVLLAQLTKPSDKILLIAEPGTGKTVFATNLMQQGGRRILCVVPYISVIESKFKTLPPEANCQFCYGFDSYDVTDKPNAVMTFDKFSRMPISDLDMCFDLIILDESHLLQMSSYRSLVPAECINRLRETKTPCVLMTGTPIAEHMFVQFTYKVMFKRQRATSKLFSLVICNNNQQKIGHACLHIAAALKSGRRVIFPTNEGNTYVAKIVAGIEAQLERTVNWQYYKKEYANQEFMYEVNRKSTLADIELLFCSSYLSVGVDINDICGFDIVYTEDFTAHEIEQFNNRLRNVDLASYYFVAKFGNDGYVRPNCFAWFMPNLRVSKIRQLELRDLIAIQTVQVDEDGKPTALFDFFARHMRMPWLLRQPDGTCTLHPTCYSLWTFEDTWRQWSYQLPVLVNQLRQYNYQIEVINSELLDDEQIGDIMLSIRDGLHEHKEKVKDDLAFMMERLENKDFFDVIVYSNAIKLLQQKYNGMTIDKTGDDYHINLYVQNLQQVHRLIKSIRMLSKYYTRETILSLYDKAEGQLSRLEKVCQSVELLDYAANDRLTTSNVKAIEYILYKMFDDSHSVMMSRRQYNVHLDRIVAMYNECYDLQAATIIEKVRQYADALIKRLAEKTTHSPGELAQNRWQLKTIPAFDSSAQINLEAQKRLIFMMFKVSLFETNKDNKTSEMTERFFGSSKAIREADNVDINASIQKLWPLVQEPGLSPTDVRNLRALVQELHPGASNKFIETCIAAIDIHNGRSYRYQLEQMLSNKQ